MRLFITRHPPEDDSSSYINAIRVDGFRNPKRYIVTQQPLPNTINDFWRLIHENNVTVIVSLNDINLKQKVKKKDRLKNNLENTNAHLKFIGIVSLLANR